MPKTGQAAFAPGNLVPGIGASPDKLLQSRLLAQLTQADPDYATRVQEAIRRQN